MAAKPYQTVALTTDDLDLLYEVSTSIHSIEDLGSMLRRILSKIRGVFGIEGASIALHDGKNREFFFIRTAEEQRNGTPPEPHRMRFPDDHGVAGWVLREKRSVMIHDVSKDARFGAHLDIQKGFVTRSMICVPLMTRKEIIGVLYALNKLSGEFTEKDLFLLEILSSSISIAIENATLYGDIKQYASTLEIENIRLLSEVRDRFDLQGMIGSSRAMRHVFALLDKVIGTTTTVFVQGETGTGKELLAKAIHYNSPLKGRPFVAENCGALNENLLESELFGHVRGAFTGAVSDKRGLFEMADGGTIFLDEIADMPHAMQTKLLRVLQESQVRPVGASRYQQVDFRLICSSNRNLLEEVKGGRFRDDLYYRVHVFPIVLPPLRERKDDIPLLSAHFLDKFAGKFKRPAARLAPQALALFMQYDWPGNIRELENEIERALTLAGGDSELKVDYLSEKMIATTPKEAAPCLAGLPLQKAIEQLERRLVASALQAANGNRSQAARDLGLTRQGLLNKIKRYKILKTD
ncbi:MAG: sigma 54-interacting transcriptional regulator [Deltaproteobacteria bacterium]|nr:sigma 54-interacting transcriptional regulator [Deltaproteobacteria bacterium]